jgi:redox-sensitive bicupin YhaK (pirin superfamily)
MFDYAELGLPGKVGAPLGVDPTPPGFETVTLAFRGVEHHDSTMERPELVELVMYSG